jgi:hypothetical protein
MILKKSHNNIQMKFIIIIAVLSTAVAMGYYTAKWKYDINTKNVKVAPNYSFSDNLSCASQYSTNKDFKDKHISLIGLTSDSPKALFSGIGMTSPLKKIYEDEKLLVVQLVAFASGGVDTIHLNKKTGVFTQITAGSLAGEYAYAEKGSCS